jgi:two-component system, NtrC family, sensor kinase
MASPAFRATVWVTHVMRSLSARILVGFVALTVTFGVFAVTIVLNLREVEAEATRILGVVPLSIAAGDLAQRQGDIKQYLGEELHNASGPGEVAEKIGSRRRARDIPLDEIIRQIGIDRPALASADLDAIAGGTPFPRTARHVLDLAIALASLDPLYDTLIGAPPVGLPSSSDPAFQAIHDALDPPRKAAYDALQQLRKAETERIPRLITEIKTNFDRLATTSRDALAKLERQILMRTIYLGVLAVVLGLVITAWVAVMLRPLRRLREGARRIAAGDYGKRISETGPTEIADLAREFNSMGRAVQEREEEKLRAARLAMVGRMAAQIAHEVRNPLSTIGLNTELLEEELHANATEARDLCRKIHNEVNRLTEVTEIYLGLRGGKPRLAAESLNAIINDLVAFVRNDLATRGVALTTELDPADPTGHVDSNQIRQCLINLVRNAADAVSAKGGGNIVLRTRTDRTRVEIAVEDDGVGIENDQLPRLFDPFFSTKKSGTGLGLALTQQIILDHGGDIRVASRVGRGTTFTLSVPAG